MTESGQTEKSTKFTDKAGREWEVALDLLAVRRIENSDFSEILPRELEGKDWTILQPNKELFSVIMQNSTFLFAMVYAIVQPQVKEKLSIDPEESEDCRLQAESAFLGAMDGPSIERGKEAFWNSISDFFPDLASVLSMLREQQIRATKRIAAKIGEMGSEVGNLLDNEIDQHLDELPKTLRKELAKTREGTDG